MKDHPVAAALLIVGGVFALFVLSIVVLVKVVGGGDNYLPGDHVGVIEVSGVITDPKPTLEKLVEFRKDPQVKAIVLRINSPGGEVGPSQEIYTEVRRTVKEKQVVASLGGVAASGGYYIASACGNIVSNPGTITGSIGVILEFSNVEGLLRKIGVQANVIKSGAFKDVGSPVRPMTTAERALIQGMLDSVHQQFINAVAEGRKIPAERVRAIADGRIMSGEQARQLGLVDSLGNLQDAIRVAGRLGGIKGEAEAVYAKEKPSSFLEYLLGKEAASLAFMKLSDYQLRYMSTLVPSLR
ncbi:MAG: signal peptide peptidase SppA [Pseudomonadota bacterium]